MARVDAEDELTSLNEGCVVGRVCACGEAKTFCDTSCSKHALRELIDTNRSFAWSEKSASRRRVGGRSIK